MKRIRIPVLLLALLVLLSGCAGKKKTDDPVLAQNWEHLANKRLNRFSNAGLGDMWYALGLETPAPVRQQQQMPFGGRPMRGGFRR